MSRRLARETALQVLFQLDMNKDEQDIDTLVRHWAQEFAVPEVSIPFARELVEGTLNHLAEIDEKIGSLSEGWAVARMANVDRNVLRFAAWEILFRPDIPGRVSLNEAIELAKRFGGTESAKFVNGILDRLVESAAKAEARTTEARDSAPVRAGKVDGIKPVKREKKSPARGKETNEVSGD